MNSDQGKPPPCRYHAPLTKVIAGEPLDIVAIDILSGLPTTESGYKYILDATDYFTKWLEAYPLRDQEASTCMRALYNGFFSRMGLPRQLHSDQGRNFESKLVQELCKITGIHKTRTTPFHPRSDGQTERANRTILHMLRTSAQDNPADWPNRLPTLLAAYRMTPHNSTGVSPNMAMLGREVLLPCTLIAAPPESDISLTTPFVTSFRQTLREAHNKVRENLATSAKTQKTSFDARIRPHTFVTGQKVWLYWPKPLLKQQRHKLTQLWTGPWEIIQVKTPLVVVLAHCNTGKRQTVHVDRLLPCSDSQDTPETQGPSTPSTRRTNRKQPVVVPQVEREHQSTEENYHPRRSTRSKRPPPHLHSYV